MYMRPATKIHSFIQPPTHTQSRSQTTFCMQSLVKVLFSFDSSLGSPIRLHCKSVVLHGNNGNQESKAIKGKCRTLGYTGLKPDCKNAVVIFVNDQEVFVSLPTGSRSLETWDASKIIPVSHWRWHPELFIPWYLELLRKITSSTECLSTALSCTMIVLYLTWHHIHS